MRRLVVVVLAGLLTLGIVPFVPSGGQVSAGDRACFDGVPYCAENAFLAFWQKNGGLEILGLPVSQPFVDNRGLIVQFYERAIMEWHPENEPRYQVLLTLLGSDRLGTRSERTAPAVPCANNCATFAETGHTLRGVFKDYWESNGGLPVFGFPLTEEFTETNAGNGKQYTVQYFERNRFEYHPENEGRYQVLLGRLGAESLETQPQVLGRPAAQVPDYTGPTATIGLPATLSIPEIGVNAPVLPVGLDSQNNMDSPKTATDTAWYQFGPRPGEPGNAAIAGHVDFAGAPNGGRAVFWDLHTLTSGSEIFVIDDAGNRRRFVVKTVEVFDAATAPRERVFGPTNDVNLNLITCIGDFDPGSRSYDKRVVVFATWDGVVR